MTGLAGLREVEQADHGGDPPAQLAFEVLVRAVSAAIAAMTTALGSLDALVFSAGAGERSSLLRSATCARVAHLGVALDAVANARDAEQIGAPDAAVNVLVVRAGEEIVIARETAALLRGQGRPTAGAPARISCPAT